MFALPTTPVKTGENPLMLVAGGEEKEPFGNSPEHSVLNKVCPQQKLTRA